MDWNESERNGLGGKRDEPAAAEHLECLATDALHQPFLAEPRQDMGPVMICAAQEMDSIVIDYAC
jgi:hypothetical protein